MNRRRQKPLVRSQPLPDRIKNLLRYYIECVREDEGQPIRAPLHDSGRRFIPWPFSSDLWFLDDTEPRITLERTFADEIKRTSAGSTLLYGYPTIVELGQSRGYEAVPLFLWQIEYELNGLELWLQPVPEWPTINPTWLSSLGLRPEEQREFVNSLGIFNATDDPPNGLILDLVARIEEMGVVSGTHEPIDPRQLSNLRDARSQGLTNSAALFPTERPRYTAGLIAELHEMVDSDSPGWDSTALATMLGEREARETSEQAAIEVVPLNEEQREAVRRAINSPLTAVTGPPGTGKSQIVVSMIADAYVRGRRVLFASKNHKAVDVVETRVANLATTPLMLRTGGQFGRQLTEGLVSMLALQPSRTDRLQHEKLTAQHQQLQRQESNLWAELQAIRALHSQLVFLDNARSRFAKEYTTQEWERLHNTKGLPDVGQLTMALQLTNEHIAASSSLLRRLAKGYQGPETGNESGALLPRRCRSAL